MGADNLARDVRRLRAGRGLGGAFLPARADDEAWTVRLLRQIDAPESTRVLAKVSAYCDDDTVRSTARSETLKTRPPQDYLETLVDMIHTPATYAIEPVAGPGSKGVLIIDTPRYHVERTYNAPLPFQPGYNFNGYIGYDLNGLPIAVRGREIKEGISLEAAEYRTMGWILNAQAKAIATQGQLEEDARSIDRANARGVVVNARVAAILKESFGALTPQGRGGRLAPTGTSIASATLRRVDLS